tara:strand:+ start:438 stop:767 length:330 start_codon:yes stop_codon:yes gene_type:complete
MDGLSEAMHAFHKHDYLYTRMRETIDELPTDIGNLVELSRRATLYINESTSQSIEQYVATTSFSYHSDGIGLINTYAEDFFKTLLDERRSSLRKAAYEKAMRGLRDAVR